MRVVAVIPARGGSKGVPSKNLRRVGDASLVHRAVTSCREASLIDEVFVSSDDDAIVKEAASAGAEVIWRPPELSTDSASSESALLHALDEIEVRSGAAPEILVFVQCTSPFIDSASLDRAVRRLLNEGFDSVFAAIETFEFLWELDASSVARAINHDASVRQRRQDRAPHYRETGAFYVMSAAGFREARHRFFGRVGVEVVAANTALEIDEPIDLALAEAVDLVLRPSASTNASAIRALVMDFDGVHTDDSVYVDQDGRELVRASRSDGHGVRLMREAGIEMLILSTETNGVVARRAEKLSVECRHGIDEKLAELEAWRVVNGFGWDEIAYVGNDVNDLECMRAVGFPIAVADANGAVRSEAVFVTSRVGGSGAVREIADYLLSHR